MRLMQAPPAVTLGLGLVIGPTQSPAASAPSQGEVLIGMVGAKVHNAFWTVDPRMQPQIGQSFILDRTISSTSAVLHPSSIAIAKKWKYLGLAYRARNFSTLTGHGSVKTTTVLNIWKSNTGTPLPTDPTPKKGGFDVAAGAFTNTYTATYSVPLETTLTLDPGVYLIAWCTDPFREGDGTRTPRCDPRKH